MSSQGKFTRRRTMEIRKAEALAYHNEQEQPHVTINRPKGYQPRELERVSSEDSSHGLGSEREDSNQRAWEDAKQGWKDSLRGSDPEALQGPPQHEGELVDTEQGQGADNQELEGAEVPSSEVNPEITIDGLTGPEEN